jgi:hypothetical protein
MLQITPDSMLQTRLWSLNDLTTKYQARPNRHVMDKHSSLLLLSVSDEEKSFAFLDEWWQKDSFEPFTVGLKLFIDAKVTQGLVS